MLFSKYFTYSLIEFLNLQKKKGNLVKFDILNDFVVKDIVGSPCIRSIGSGES